MKFKIILLTLILTTACAPLCASDKKPSRLEAARARLFAHRGQKAPKVPHAERSDAAPTMQDVIAAVDDEETFIKRLRAHLDDNPGCTTWDDSCESACPTWDKSMVDSNIYYTDLSNAPGFDQPITCKSHLESCYQTLRGCSQEDLDTQLAKLLNSDQFNFGTHPQARCMVIALVCQGANPNAKSFDRKQTALHHAAYEGDYHLAEFLLKKGADVDPEDKNECSPLDINMWQEGSARIARLLVEHGANINKKSGGNETPLMSLAGHCFTNNKASIREKAAFLLNSGAETHHSNHDGTAVDIARKHLARFDSSACKALADFIEDYEKQPNRIME